MTEDQLEQEALEWLAELGYTHVYGPDIAHDGGSPERDSYRQVVLVERLRAEAEAAGVTLSDVLRSHLTLAEAKPLAKPRPQFRPKKLGEVSGADPALMRQIAGIGNNLNQLARSVNAGLLGGSGVNTVEILMRMEAMERHLDAISRHHAH